MGFIRKSQKKSLILTHFLSNVQSKNYERRDIF